MYVAYTSSRVADYIVGGGKGGGIKIITISNNKKNIWLLRWKELWE